MPLTLSRSVRRKVLVTCGAALGFSLLYEARTFDSRAAARQAAQLEETAVPAPGRTVRFWATAYCKGETTASGVQVRRGIAAADPSLLPVGSVVKLEARDPQYSGIYTIMDTGPAVKGRGVDLYMWSCYEALAFGRRRVELTVLRLGWNPNASTPGVIDTLFRQREDAQKNTPPARPPAIDPNGPGSVDPGAGSPGAPPEPEQTGAKPDATPRDPGR